MTRRTVTPAGHAHHSQTQVYDKAYEPILPGYVLSHLRDGREPLFVGDVDAAQPAWSERAFRGQARR